MQKNIIMIIDFLKANINHDILFILAALTIYIGYIGGFVCTAMFIAFHVKEEDDVNV